jgi:regulatory protein
MITAIEKIKKTNKYLIFYNGEAAGALSSAALLLARLSVGQEIGNVELRKRIEEGERSDALNDLLSALSRFTITESGAKHKLTAKGYSESAIGYAISRAKEYGYIDDAEYAKRYVESNIRNKGKRRIKEELKQKGLDSGIIEENLAKSDEYSSCRETLATILRLKKIQKLHTVPYADKAKIVRSLLYKGFDYDTIKQAFADYECDTEENYD